MTDNEQRTEESDIKPSRHGPINEYGVQALEPKPLIGDWHWGERVAELAQEISEAAVTFFYQEMVKDIQFDFWVTHTGPFAGEPIIDVHLFDDDRTIFRTKLSSIVETFIEERDPADGKFTGDYDDGEFKDEKAMIAAFEACLVRLRSFMPDPE